MWFYLWGCSQVYKCPLSHQQSMNWIFGWQRKHKFLSEVVFQGKLTSPKVDFVEKFTSQESWLHRESWLPGNQHKSDSLAKLIISYVPCMRVVNFRSCFIQEISISGALCAKIVTLLVGAKPQCSDWRNVPRMLMSVVSEVLWTSALTQVKCEGLAIYFTAF